MLTWGLRLYVVGETVTIISDANMQRKPGDVGGVQVAVYCRVVSFSLSYNAKRRVDPLWLTQSS